MFFIEFKTDSTGHVFHEYPFDTSAETASVTKVADGNWTAKTGKNTVTTIPLNGMTNTEFEGESYVTGTSCNAMDFTFSSSSPWDTGNMNAKIQDGPYVVDSITSNGWRSHGS